VGKCREGKVKVGGEGSFREVRRLRSGQLVTVIKPTFERLAQIFSMSWVRVAVRLDIGVEPT